jgi:Predicted permeases
MRILSRYILKEMVAPTLLGFGFYTFIILMRNLFDLAEMIIKRSLPFATVLKLLGLTLPNIVVLTIPMSLLFGILIAIGRLSADSEIIAMRSVGIPTSQIYRPVFYFSFIIFTVNLYLMNVVLPRGNSALQELKSEIFTSAIEKEISPRVFYDEFANWVIYVNDVDPVRGTWRGVFLSDANDPASQKIIVADSGHLTTVGPTKQVWAVLEGARTHISNLRKSDRYDITANRVQRFLLVDKFSETIRGKANGRFRDVRELNLFELMEQIHQARDPMDRRIVLVEIHKKISIPFACLAFGILGLPLGITNRRGGKSSGFSLSIAIILVYYVLINHGEDMARNGSLDPALAMWLPNIVLVAFGLYLLHRANVDVGARSSTLWSRLQARITDLLLRRRGRSNGEVAEQRPSIFARLDIPFPNILDRYILREFLKVLALVLVSTIVLFVIVDYSTEVAADMAENRVPISVVAAYYRYYGMQVLQMILPISILIGTLITFGMLSRNNEVTAIKANGVSLYRMALPILSIAVVASLLSYLMLDFVLPYSNQRGDQLKARIRGKETPHSFSLQQKQWIFGKGRYLFNFLSFDAKNRTLSQVQVFEFAPDKFRLTRRVYADEARFDGVGWVFVNGWMRSFSDDGSTSYTPIVNPIRLAYPERPDYFATEVKSPKQMTYAELRRYIAKLRSSGYEANELLVQLYQKTSWPFISLVMALIALPFSFRIGKRGALYGIGIALFLAFVYWTLFGVFTKFGEVGNLPAALSAWGANILFALAAIYMFLHIET